MTINGINTGQRILGSYSFTPMLFRVGGAPAALRLGYTIELQVSASTPADNDGITVIYMYADALRI